MNTKETKGQILERVKDGYAKSKGEESWSDLVWHIGLCSKDVNDIAEAYHAEMLKQIAPSDEKIHNSCPSKYFENDSEHSFCLGLLFSMRDHFINSK